MKKHLDGQQLERLAADFHFVYAAIVIHVTMSSDELIEGRLSVERIGTSSMTMLVSLQGAEDGIHRADIRLVQVQVELASGQPERISDETREAFGFPALEKTGG